MNYFKVLAKKAFGFVPPHWGVLLKFSQRYLDRHNGENNCDSATNGEEYLLRHILPSMRGGCVFDIGANVGNWTSYALSIEPSLNIHMFEPSKITYQECSQKTWPPGVHLNNFGLGEYKEIRQLNIVHATSGMNSLYLRQGVEAAEATATESVHITTLDEYCEEHGVEHIHFMKVDVEGHERAVLLGAARMLKERRVDMIQFEYGGCNLDAKVYLLDIWEILINNNYHIAKLFPSGPKPIENYSQTLENFRYSNYIAYLDKKWVLQ